MTELLQSIFADGNLTLLVLVAVGAIGGMLLERALIAAGWRAYYRLGLPLAEELVPVPFEPRGEGRTATVRWKVDGQARWVRFWSHPRDRAAPMGLHGVVGLIRGPRGVHLPVRWSPPLTPFLALVWFAGLGVVRGQGTVSVPIAMLIMVALILLYRQAAQRAARELRWAFVSGEDAPPEP